MKATFRDQYESAVADLLGELPPGSGMTDEVLAAAERQHAVRLPPALRDYYRAMGYLHTLNKAHNRLLSPDDWFVDAGRLVFLEENQSVVYWGIDTADPPGDDPPVLQGVNLHPQPIEWYPEYECCSEFLLVMLHWQAVCGGFDNLGVAGARPEVLAHFERHWKRVGRVGDLIAFRHLEQTACIIGQDNRQLFVGALTDESYEALEAELQPLGIRLDPL